MVCDYLLKLSFQIIFGKDSCLLIILTVLERNKGRVLHQKTVQYPFFFGEEHYRWFVCLFVLRLGFTVLFKVTWKWRSSCLSLSSARIKSVCYQTHFRFSSLFFKYRLGICNLKIQNSTCSTQKV